MRKAKKLAAAALAVVMALSMSVPAFAAADGTVKNQGQAVSSENYKGDGQVESKLTTDSSNTGNAAPTTGTASTNVKLIYSEDATQLTVTVPLSVTFAVQDSGKFVTPTNYTIINGSRIPVYVTGIEIKEVNSTPKYTFVNDEESVTEGSMNVYLSIAPKKGKVTTAASDYDAGQNKAGDAVKFGSTTQISDKTQWNMSAKGGDTNALNMTFDGKIGSIDAAWASDQIKNDTTKGSNKGVHLFTITYTIKAGNAESGN